MVNSTTAGDVCVQCAHPFVRSLVSFDALPLVEFVPEKGVADSLCLKYLKEEASSGNSGESKQADGDSEGKKDYDRWENVDAAGSSNRNGEDDDPMNDVFSQHMLKYEFNQPGAPYEPISVPVDVLKKMNFANVYVQKWASNGKRFQFFYNIIPDVHVFLCPHCWFFFHEEDIESAALSNGGKCPMCRKAVGL